jgi:adenylosuccinate lyase
LKDLTRTHTRIDQGAITDFIQSLDIADEVKTELLGITPENYIGVCEF